MRRPHIRQIPDWLREELEYQGSIAWRPTPKAYEAFRVRDLELALQNVRSLTNPFPEDTLHNPLTFGKAKASL